MFIQQKVSFGRYTVATVEKAFKKFDELKRALITQKRNLNHIDIRPSYREIKKQLVPSFLPS